MPATPIRAIVFDAYGTIFDVHSIADVADRLHPGRGGALSALWRTKQIDYTRLRTLANRYEPFSRVTRDALDHAIDALALDIDDAGRDTLMGEYDRLAVFADAAAALATLRTCGLPLAILSNGDPAMLDAVVSNAGLSGTFDHLLSVDTVGRFKTAPEAYAIAPRALGVAAREILFVSSNGWDAIGATWFGFTTFWIDRAGVPLDRLGARPHGRGSSLGDVVDYLTSVSNAFDASPAPNA